MQHLLNKRVRVRSVGNDDCYNWALDLTGTVTEYDKNDPDCPWYVVFDDMPGEVKLHYKDILDGLYFRTHELTII